MAVPLTEVNTYLLEVAVVGQTVGEDAQTAAKATDDQLVELADIGKEVVAY